MKGVGYSPLVGVCLACDRGVQLAELSSGARFEGGAPTLRRIFRALLGCEKISVFGAFLGQFWELSEWKAGSVGPGMDLSEIFNSGRAPP